MILLFATCKAIGEVNEGLLVLIADFHTAKRCDSTGVIVGNGFLGQLAHT